ncbi:tryptophanase [Yersinia massiliensis]|uniref:tryptophanase n=1 Tax=Yersinia massiliensis TaxID=419257 RepID=UPI00030F30A4|nr:tryptophanase [Yersinia massiliensis]
MRISNEDMLRETDLPFDKAPPYRIKAVEYSIPTTREKRKEIMQEYGYSGRLLPAKYVFINMVTDSGTGALSDRQWSAMMEGDESYFNCRSYEIFEETCQAFTKMPYIIPSHQGRSAEAPIYEIFVKPGDKVPSNTHFTTTSTWAFQRGAEPVDLICPDYLDEENYSWFKGNMNLEKFEDYFIEYAEKIPLVELVVPNNLNGGQAVSMENIKNVRAIIDKYNKIDTQLYLDIARISENAWIIKSHEPGYKDKSCLGIVNEMLSYADGCHMSAKKGGLVNMGGFIALRNKIFWQRMHPKVIRTDGFITYGGLAGRDLESLAVGLIEGVNDYYLQDRQRQVDYFANACQKRGIHILEPASCFAVYINAGKCLPHLDHTQGPATCLSAQAYIEGGFASTAMDSLQRGRIDANNPQDSSKRIKAPYELIRCAIPRRTYYEPHYDWAAECLFRAIEWGDKLPAFKPIVDDRPPLELSEIGLHTFFDDYEPVSPLP